MHLKGNKPKNRHLASEQNYDQKIIFKGTVSQEFNIRFFHESPTPGR